MREMKDSGIEWFGAIPKNWHVSKLKYVNHFFNGDRGKNYPSGNDLVDEGIIFLTSNNLHNDILDTSYENSKYITDERYKILGGAKLQIDDIVFCLRGSVGNCSINKTETCGTVASSLMTIRPHNINPDFLNYMLHSDVANSQTRLFVNGSCAENLSADNVANYLFVEPPLLEQQQIATYLNSKCSNINAIIFDIQRQIEVLQEYKQSIITEAVTKGIRGNRPMKNSGVNWIDKIPADWDFKKITWLLDYNSIYPIGDGDHGLIKADDYLENGIPFIRVQNLGWGTNLQLDNIVYISEELNHRIANSTLHPNDIIFAKTGATIGKTAIIPDSLPISNTTSHVGKITVDTKYYPKFIFHYLSSKIGYKLFWDIAQMKTTRPEVGIEEFKQVRILIPRDIEEQKEISAYIEKKCEEIDNILADKQKQLDTLTEYKNSLIYEYVTGKKEVPADA